MGAAHALLILAALQSVTTHSIANSHLPVGNPDLHFLVSRARRCGGWALRGGGGVISTMASDGEVAEGWRAKGRAVIAADPRNQQLHAAMRATVPAALEHTGSAGFDHHLLGVQAVLRGWGQDVALGDGWGQDVALGTERGEIRELVGAKSERLAWIFCVLDRGTFDATVLGLYAAGTTELGTHLAGPLADALSALDALVSPDASNGWPAPPPSTSQPGDPFRLSGLRARPELGAFPIQLESEAEWLDLVTLTLADYLEQVEGAATKANPGYGWAVGEAWGYRRVAYSAMAAVLVEERGLHPAKEMWEAVYGEEPETCRGHITARTPPLTAAARLARQAIESA
ncbi:hypothetical protein T484DRAFT_1957105 [Baffinella frigidus]|nr:hypothetical protein T484DRAFT_1957105 [Cryptophyta sp. CCMP2293]